MVSLIAIAGGGDARMCWLPPLLPSRWIRGEESCRERGGKRCRGRGSRLLPFIKTDISDFESSFYFTYCFDSHHPNWYMLHIWVWTERIEEHARCVDLFVVLCCVVLFCVVLYCVCCVCCVCCVVVLLCCVNWWGCRERGGMAPACLSSASSGLLSVTAPRDASCTCQITRWSSHTQHAALPRKSQTYLILVNSTL